MDQTSTNDILVEVVDSVGVLTLNRPAKLDAWSAQMRDTQMDAIRHLSVAPQITAIVLTGAGERAFSAGQYLQEAQAFDADAAEVWMNGWETFYTLLRGLTKPLIVALNGLAAGSGFQVALLADIWVGHAGVRMGQPEINAGIATVIGSWLMNTMLGMSRTVELTLTGRLMDADECRRIGLLHHVTEPVKVLPLACSIAAELGVKPQVAMRLNKQRFRELTEESFRQITEAGIRIQRESFASGEPHRMIKKIFQMMPHSYLHEHYGVNSRASLYC